jgi:hypothetical protein
LSRFSEVPEMEQIAGVVETKVTGSPLEALAISERLLLDKFTWAGGANVIDCELRVIRKVNG